MALCKQLEKRGESGLRLEFLIGSISLLTNDFTTARSIFSRLAKRHPNHSRVLNNLGAALLHTGGKAEEAQQLMEKSIELDPGNIPALVSLGELYLGRKKRDEAKQLYQRMIELAPENPQGYFGLGLCAQVMNDSQKAEQYFEQARERAPNHLSILSNLLQATTQNKRHDKAIHFARQIITTPGMETIIPTAWAILKRYCLWKEASELLPHVIDYLLAPETPPDTFTPIALEIVSSDEIDHQMLKRLYTKCGNGLRQRNTGFARTANTSAHAPSRRMRIGYLSGDFRNHVVSPFIRGVINHHDRSRFEIFLYSNAPISAQDETTSKYFRVAEHFVHCHEMDDGELAQRIAQDGIHVLIDLSGFTMHTRMTTLTLQPAPVQMTYIGYPATYGLPEVDYIISNSEITGSDHASAFIEAPLELPGRYSVSPAPLGITRPALLPCSTNNFVTFGSLINCYKINRSTLALWSRVLRAVTDSRIYLNHPHYACSATREALLQAFAEEGIALERVTITDERPENGGAHFLLYDNIDIVLDATPMTGGAGTSDALAVGVPVMSRMGTIFHERLSAAAVFANVPEPKDCLAESDDEFVRKAVALAGEPEKLARLRPIIRQNVLTGANCRAEAFTGELEALYCEGWNRKFPEQPIDSLCSWEQETECIETPPFQLDLSAARNDLHRFVARETGRWFEPECEFIARHAASFQTIWDISDDPGLATIPVAASLTGEQTMTCLRVTREARQLMAQNSTRNGVSAHCKIVARVEDLCGSPLLVRIAAERNDSEATLLRQILAQTDSPPLVLLVSTDGPNGPDASTVDHLVQFGYQRFRLHTGCNVMVTEENVTNDSGFQRNVFCVIPEAIPLLEEHGLLCSAAETPGQIPLPEGAFITSGSSIIVPPKHSTPANSEWGSVYLSALKAYALAHNESPCRSQAGLVQPRRFDHPATARRRTDGSAHHERHPSRLRSRSPRRSADTGPTARR